MYRVLCSGKFFILKEKLVSLFNKTKEKALDAAAADSVAKVELKGSHGWLDRCLRGGQLHSLKVTGKRAAAVTEVAEKFPEELKEITAENGYLYKQVLNCDKNKTYWKKLLSKTFIFIKEKEAKRHKALEDRFTLILLLMLLVTFSLSLY